MKNLKVLTILIASAMLISLLGGCSTAPKSYEIKADADPIINRDVSGRPLSVVVRLYQLKDIKSFQQLTFDTLASGRPETELLGAELIEKSELTVVPGAHYIGVDQISNEAKYLGIVAFFREPDPHYWRYLVDAGAIRSNGLRFRVQDCSLVLVDIKPVPIPGQPASSRINCGGPRVAPLSSRSYQMNPGQPAAPAQPAQNSGWGSYLPEIKMPGVKADVGPATIYTNE